MQTNPEWQKANSWGIGQTGGEGDSKAQSTLGPPSYQL